MDLKEALEGRSEITIGVYGRKTGRLIETPVWFVLEGDRILLLPVYGSRTNWYKNLKANSKIRITAGGYTAELEAKTLEEKDKVEYVKKKFEEKYGKDQIKRWYTGFDAAVEVPIQ